MPEKKHIVGHIRQELNEQHPFDESADRYNLDTPNGVNEAMDHLTSVRNRMLITPEQQELLRSMRVAFLGLSVGSGAVRTWVMQARPDEVIISDPDKLSPSNLNRVPAGWKDVGKEKVDFSSREIGRMHPGCKTITFTSPGIVAFERIFQLSPHAVVDEMDDFAAKIVVRKMCRKRGTPLISATDVGDNVMLDVERYDKRPKPAPFLGRVKSFNLDDLDPSRLSPQERMKLIMEVIGFDACSEEMIDSLLAVGKRLKTWPQLGATATIAGGVVATTLKKLFLGEPVKSGRYYINLDQMLTPDKSGSRRLRKIKEFQDLLGI